METTAGARELIAGLTTDRLLVADRTEEGVVVIGLAHEAMLSSWPRLAQWVQRNRESLKVRAQVAADSSRWIENNRNPDYLYDAGLPLEKARAAQREGFLDPHETEFVEVSGRHVAAEASRRHRALRRWLVAVGVVAIIAVGTGVLAWKKKREAVAAKKAADSLINYMQHDLSNKLGKLGYLSVMQSLNAKIRKYHEDHPAEAGDLETERERGVALDQQGDVLRGQGDLEKALRSYRESLAIFAKLTKQDPANTDWQHYLAGSYNKVGDALRARWSGLPAALQSYRDALAISEKLVKQNPANADWHRELSLCYLKVGEILSLQSSPHEAIMSYGDGLAILFKLPEQDRAGTVTQHICSRFYSNLGDVLSLVDLPDARVDALKRYRDCLGIVEKLAKDDPSNAQWQRELSVSYAKIADVLTKQKDFSGALQNYRASVAIAERLVSQDPSNFDWQRDLSVNYLGVGDVLLAQKDLPGALQSYRASIAIGEGLLQKDPFNPSVRNLPGGYARLGNVLKAQGDFPGARDSYIHSVLWAKVAVAGYSIEVFPELGQTQVAKADSSKSGVQREVSVSYLRLADFLSEQGDLPEALKNYYGSLGVFEELAKEDPANAEWQRELAVGHVKVGDARIAQKDFAGALKSYRDALAVAEALAKQDPANADQELISLSLGRVAQASLAMPQPDRPEAQRLIDRGLAILVDLEKKNPLSPSQKENRTWLQGLRKKAKG